MDEECLRESGVMLIRANRALIRGSSLLLDGSEPFSFSRRSDAGSIHVTDNRRKKSDEEIQKA